jgi:hypothetical protein
VDLGEPLVPDMAGADLRDPDQAWEAARATARDLMGTQVEADVIWLTCHFEVSDEAGEIVFDLSFAEVAEVAEVKGKPN